MAFTLFVYWYACLVTQRALSGISPREIVPFVFLAAAGAYGVYIWSHLSWAIWRDFFAKLTPEGIVRPRFFGSARLFPWEAIVAAQRGGGTYLEHWRFELRDGSAVRLIHVFFRDREAVARAIYRQLPEDAVLDDEFAALRKEEEKRRRQEALRSRQAAHLRRAEQLRQRAKTIDRQLKQDE